MEVNTRPDTISNIASYYQVSSEKLRRHYKGKVSGFKQWNQLSHAEEYLLYSENIGEYLSIDEVSLSKGELYTIVTNKNIKRHNKTCIVAVINGTEAKTIQAVLEKIPMAKRQMVKEVSMDMARNMNLASKNCFPNSKSVIDRFHVVRLVMDALQHIRVKLRWKAIDEENIAIKKAKDEGRKYQPEILSNGDTLKELLARSRYLLYKLQEEWTHKQSLRAKELFEKYPKLKKVYDLTLLFRSLYKTINKSEAIIKFNEWKNKAIELKIDELSTVVYSIEHHLEGILNFFDYRSTNAYAESFNSKIKAFRANLRGVTDVKFFLFRLQKLFA